MFARENNNNNKHLHWVIVSGICKSPQKEPCFCFFGFFFVISRTTCRKTCVSVNSHMMLVHGNNRLWKSCIIHKLVYCITNETQQQTQTLEMYAVPHYWLFFFTIPHIYTSYTVPLYMYLQWCTGWCTQRPNLHPPTPRSEGKRGHYSVDVLKRLTNNHLPCVRR